ncbi:MAG: hypothetical protein J6C55_01375 [Oscillospiraceae bacterium]|nr:hypothetical protein [Oscillospiraceae bacterium]
MITGKILDIDNEKISVQEYDYFGEKLEKTNIYYIDIYSMFYDTFYEKNIEILISK